MSVGQTSVSSFSAPVAGAQPGAPRRERRIFYLLDSLNVGGTETQAVELARRISAAGYQVTLGCLRAQGPLLEKLRDTAVDVCEFHPKGGIDTPAGIYQMLRLSRFLRRGRFDVVHTHDLWSNLMGVPAARLAGIPAIVSSRRDLAHLEWYRGRRRVWLRRIQNLSGTVVVNAAAIRDALTTDEGFAPRKLQVIYNGVDIDKFHSARRDRDHLFPGIGDAKLIVLVGNMHGDIKGHASLIAAAPAVVREFPSVRFVLVGDGQQRKIFEEQTTNAGLTDKFIFLGRRSDVPEVLACCDMAVLPSLAEGLPNAVLEYLAAGMPTVASKVGGNAEILKDGETGLLVPPGDATALSTALLKLLQDPALAQRIARNGFQFVSQQFSFDALVTECDALYTRLLQRRGVND